MEFKKMEVLSDLSKEIDDKFNELFFSLSEVQELLNELSNNISDENDVLQLDPTIIQFIQDTIRSFLVDKGYS